MTNSKLHRLLVVLAIATTIHAQQEPVSLLSRLPAPPPNTVNDRSQPNDSYLFNFGAFCGIGATTSSASTRPTTGCGAGISIYPIPVLFLEAGVMTPQANRSFLSAYLSVDSRIPVAPRRVHYLPMIIAGYSRLFETGHALDYGLALATPRFGSKNHSNSFQFELRDYWTFANPTQHNIVLRIGWMSPEYID